MHFYYTLYDGKYDKEEMPKFIEVNGTNIPYKKEVKLLGITIDEKLKFDNMLIFYVKNQLDR